MRSPDILATDCLRDFEHWLAQETEGAPGAVPERQREILLRAFVAGYEKGGICGAREMHAEAIRGLRELSGA